jgi:hypothetical protein
LPIYMYHIQDDLNLHQHCCENPTSHNSMVLISVLHLNYWSATYNHICTIIRHYIPPVHSKLHDEIKCRSRKIFWFSQKGTSVFQGLMVSLGSTCQCQDSILSAAVRFVFN